MRDIPMYTTEHGVATLTLKEIPYRQEAYIQIRDVQPGMLEALIGDCVDFCKAAGAERIFANGHEGLGVYPLHTVVLEMKGDAVSDPEKVAHIFPVTRKTVGRWREICNSRMGEVDNAGTLTFWDEGRILKSGGAYFVHDTGELLGIGWIAEGRLQAIASARPGAGETVAHTLFSTVEGTRLSLEVVSTNFRAIRLYEKLGFIRTGELFRWYRVL